MEKNHENVLEWENTINRVIPAIVSLELITPRAFDTNSAGCSSATGFVVDCKYGIIMTNR